MLSAKREDDREFGIIPIRIYLFSPISHEERSERPPQPPSTHHRTRRIGRPTEYHKSRHKSNSLLFFLCCLGRCLAHLWSYRNCWPTCCRPPIDGHTYTQTVGKLQNWNPKIIFRALSRVAPHIGQLIHLAYPSGWLWGSRKNLWPHIKDISSQASVSMGIGIEGAFLVSSRIYCPAVDIVAVD